MERDMQADTAGSVTGTEQLTDGRTEGTEDMSRHVEDYTENAPCGMHIRYSVDDRDFVVYNDINGRGEGKLSPTCKRCSWKGICRPTPPEVHRFCIDMELIFSGEQMEILEASYGRAQKQGYTGNIGEYVEHLAHVGACTTLLEIARNL